MSIFQMRRAVSGSDSSRRGQDRWSWLLLVLAVVSIAGGDVIVRAQDAAQGDPEVQDEEEEQEESDDLFSLYYSAHLPTDRQLSQDLEMARRLLDEGRYSEGLSLIDHVMDASEDALDLEGARDSSKPAVSLKTKAKQLLAELPPEGFAALELATGVDAQRALDNALQSGDFDAIRHIAGRYPLTKAAAQAKAIVAQAAQDGGDFGTAATHFEQLAQYASLEQQLRLTFLIRSAICWSEAGESAKLQTVLATLAKDYPAAQRDKLVGGDFEEWQKQVKERAEKVAPSAGAAAWGIEGGGPARNPRVESDLPHAWPAWQARTVQEVNLQEQILERSASIQRERRTWLPMASPIAVGDLIIARTPRNIVAVDWKTGRRIWETRADSISDQDEVLNISEQHRGRNKGYAFEPIEQRIWVDSIYAGLSADGRRAYAVGDLPPAASDNYGSWRGQFFWGVEETTQELEGNSLSAYELESEGKLVWRIHGGTAAEELAGAFFLGPPLAVSDQLYALAEIRNSIYLLALEPTTGHLEWKQPLANMERNVADDTLRRIAGATPSYASGLIICPTSAGCVVAVDPTDRSIRWVYRFGVDESVATQQTAGWNQNRGAYKAKLSERWARVRCIVAENSVVVTSPETDELHCLDPETGNLRWSLPREERILVVGIAQGKVLIAGSDWLEARELSDGSAAWSTPRTSMPDEALLVGLPLIAVPQVLVPLTGGQVGAVDVATGKLAATLQMQSSGGMGNLAYHRGTLVSQSAVSLTRYDQLPVIRQEAEQASAASPPDPQALRILGEIAWSEGDLAGAIERFEQAFEAAPDDTAIRSRLTGGLLEGLKQDYPSYQDRSELLTRLLADNGQRAELLRVHIDGSLAAGDLAEAWEYALELFEHDRDETAWIASDHLAVVDRWFAARMSRLWDQADPPLRETMTQQVTELTERAQGDFAALSQTARYFGSTPAGAAARLEVARQLIEKGRLSEAELVLLQTRNGWLSSSPYFSAHQSLLQRIAQAGSRGNVATPDRQATSTAASDSAFRGWNDGKLETTKRRVAARSDMSNSHMRGQNASRILLSLESSGASWTGPLQLALADGGSQLVGWDELGTVVCRVPVAFQGYARGSGRPDVRAYRFGHFCVVSAGNQLASVDLRVNLRNGPGPQLWSNQDGTEDSYAYESGQIRVWQQRQGVFVPSARSSGTAQSHHSGQVCTANPWGVVVRDGETVRCFDPLDGELLWQREGVPAGGETFSDGENLIMARAGEAHGILISMIDGSLLGQWKRPPAKWVGTVGGNAITLIKGIRGQQLRVVEVATGKSVFYKTYPTGAALAYPDARTIVAMDRKGKLEVVDALEGDVRFTQHLSEEPNLRSLHVVRDGETFYVGVNTLSANEHEKGGHIEVSGAPLVTGKLYALDVATGAQRWTRPATLDGHGLALLQAPRTPVLLLVSHHRKTPESSGNETTRLLCLDKRNGRSLIREEGMASMETHSYTLSTDRATPSKAIVDLERTVVELEFTDHPRPPEPVAQSEVEVAPVRKEGTFWGIFGSLGGPAAGEPADDDDD